MSNDFGLIWSTAVTNTSVHVMTNLWLWNCVCDPWKLSRNNGFYPTRKYYTAFFKVWANLSQLKIGRFFFCDGTWYTWTFWLPSMWRQLLWWKIVRCFKRWLHCTRLYNYCFQSSEALGGFWSFLKLYMYIQIKTLMYTITSHKKRRAKYQTEMLSWIMKQHFR